MALSTILLSAVANLARTHVELMPVAGVGGFTDEPALSLCNNVLQELLAAPLDWKFNRAEMGMLPTSPNKQDYLFAGAAAFSLGNTPQGWAIDLASANALTQGAGVVTLKFLEAPGFAIGDTIYLINVVLKSDGVTASVYNATFTQTNSSSTWTGGYVVTGVNLTTKSVTFAGATSETSGAAGITDFGWLAGASAVGLSSNAAILPTTAVEAVRDLQPYGFANSPEKVSIVRDYGTGILKIRFYPVSGNILWGANLVYQKKAPLATVLTATWAPFPDELSYVYRQGFLAQAYRYVNSPRADIEYQKFEAAIGKALGADDRETSDRHFYPEIGLNTSLDNWGIF